MIKGGYRRLPSLVLGLLVASFAVACSPVKAAAPQTISFQARVLSKDRLTAPTGNYAFRFSLYPTESGGTAAWQEAWTGSGIAVRYGLFSVELGSINPLTSLDWSNTTYWLGIEFDSDQNGTLDQSFASRVPLTAAPYALSAQTLSSTLGLAQGGTGATTAAAALNNLLPSQSGQSGKVLISNGTNASWSSFDGGAADATYITLSGHSGLSNERVLQGTSNQVIITDGGANGNLTLSLPQDIGLSSSVIFKKVSLGTTQNTGNSTYPLYYDDPASARSFAITGDGQILVTGAEGVNASYRSIIAGESTERFIIKANGTMTWGDGTNARDTDLYRSGVNTLKADGGLVLGSSSTATLSGSTKLDVGGHAIFRAPDASGVAFYLDATNVSGSLFRLMSSGSTATWGGQFSGAGNFALTDSNQVWLWVSPANNKIVVNGDLESIGNTKIMAQSDVRFYDSDSSNYVGLQSAATVGSDLVWTLPSTDSSGCLSSNGSGTLSWAACSGGSGAPTTASYLTLGLDGTLSSERVLTGTANQVILTDGGANGNLTLSLPQSIATTSGPTFANLTDSGLTSGRLTYAGTNGLLQDTANMAYNTTNGLVLAAGSSSGLQLSSTAGTAASGILFGTDTDLYRAAADTLQSDDLMRISRANAGDYSLATQVSGDAYARFSVGADGQILWGTGSAVRDVNLYRGAADELRTDDLLSFGSSKSNSVTDFKTYKTDGGIAFIFDTSSTYSTGSLLSIRNNNVAKLNLSASGNLTIAGTLTQSGTPADLAENIKVSDDSITAGDIVSIDNRSDETVRKAVAADSAIAGVISTEPGILISGGTDGRPLALAGRVPVKVEPTANIKRGDLVVASATPGLGTKSGDAAAPSVGIALTDQKDGSVTVQLQPGYYIPNFGSTTSSQALSPQQSGVLDALSLIDGTININSLSVDRLAVNSDLIVNGNLRVAGGLTLPALESANATLPAGQTSLFVNTSRVTPTDRVLITPVTTADQTLTGNLSRGPIVAGQGFWVYISAAQSDSVKFDWLLIH